MRLLEGIFFVGLAGAAHLGLWASTSNAPSSAAAGAEGAHAQTVAAALPSHTAMVATWTRSPETAPTPIAMLPPPVTASGPRLPEVQKFETLDTPRPIAPTPAPDMPVLDTEVLQPPPDVMRAHTRPKARPENIQQPQRRKQVAAGNGGHNAKGTQGRTAVSSQDATQTRALMATWGAQINAKLQRNMVYPVGTSARGTARLALTIKPNGTLTHVAVTRSAGDAALDNAALKAAKRAGRFAAAPRGLTKAQYVFSISLTFSRD